MILGLGSYCRVLKDCKHLSQQLLSGSYFQDFTALINSFVDYFCLRLKEEEKKEKESLERERRAEEERRSVILSKPISFESN